MTTDSSKDITLNPTELKQLLARISDEIPYSDFDRWIVNVKEDTLVVESDGENVTLLNWKDTAWTPEQAALMLQCLQYFSIVLASTTKTLAEKNVSIASLRAVLIIVEEYLSAAVANNAVLGREVSEIKRVVSTIIGQHALVGGGAA